MYAFYSIMFVGVYPVMELCQYMRYNATPKCGAVNVFVIYIFALPRILGAFPICRKSVANPLEKIEKKPECNSIIGKLNKRMYANMIIIIKVSARESERQWEREREARGVAKR